MDRDRLTSLETPEDEQQSHDHDEGDREDHCRLAILQERRRGEHGHHPCPFFWLTAASTRVASPVMARTHASGRSTPLELEGNRRSRPAQASCATPNRSAWPPRPGWII